MKVLQTESHSPSIKGKNKLSLSVHQVEPELEPITVPRRGSGMPFLLLVVLITYLVVSYQFIFLMHFSSGSGVIYQNLATIGFVVVSVYLLWLLVRNISTSDEKLCIYPDYISHEYSRTYLENYRVRKIIKIDKIYKKDIQKISFSFERIKWPVTVTLLALFAGSYKMRPHNNFYIKIQTSDGVRMFEYPIDLMKIDVITDLRELGYAVTIQPGLVQVIGSEKRRWNLSLGIMWLWVTIAIVLFFMYMIGRIYY